MNKFTIQHPFAISAGAGSGKTYTLSRRFVNTLLGFDFFIETPQQPQHFEHRYSRRADLSQVVTITYTEAAAHEMQERIFTLIGKILAYPALDPQESDYPSIAMGYADLESADRIYVAEQLQKAQQEISRANITTIHGFCLAMLRRHSDIAKIDGTLEVLDGEEQGAIFETVFFDVLNDTAFQDEILAVTRHVSLFKSKKLIESYVFSHQFRSAFDHYASDHEAIKTLLINTFLVPLEPMIEAAHRELVGNERRSAFEAFVRSFYDFDARKFTEAAETLGVSKSLGAKRYPATDAAKKALESCIDFFLKVDGEAERRFVDIIERFRRLLHAIKTAYDAILQERRTVDFDTIIQKAAEIIPDVHSSIRYIMVDEFQDTNAVQWEIVRTIADKGADLFVVGDEKQSIYAFQGAEIEVFHRAIRRRYGSRTVQMGENYRSDRSIIEFVNTLFASLFAPSEQVSGTCKQIAEDYEARFEPLSAVSDDKGSVTFLVSRDDEEESEAENIARLIKSIVEGERYPDIGRKIAANEPAIAVLYDARGKMLALRDALQSLGVACKVSASEEFFHTEEISDIFFVLKSLHLLRDVPSIRHLDEEQRFFIVGAMRSSILHFTDREIFEALQSDELPEWFIRWRQKAAATSTSRLITEILEESAAYAAYALMGNYEQRLANINQLLREVIDFERSYGYDLAHLTDRWHYSLFQSDAEHPEAFFLSDTTDAIELRTIHSAKGLAFPMVILADTAKNLSTQVTKEVIKFNAFNDSDGDAYNLVGFEVSSYTPLSHRLLKEIDKRKHMAEKKRLLYVALTRPKHHLILSANLKSTNSGVGKISHSYLEMMLDALELTKEQLFDRDALPDHSMFLYKDDLVQYPAHSVSSTLEPVESLPSIAFHDTVSTSATAKDTLLVIDDTLDRASLRGTLVHKALELFWDRLHEEEPFDQLFHKAGVFDKALRDDVKKIARNFLQTDVYQRLKTADQYFFEFGFDEVLENGDERRGSIDLLLKDGGKGWSIVDFKSGKERHDPAYEKQLHFYKEVMQAKGFKISETEICWLE